MLTDNGIITRVGGFDEAGGIFFNNGNDNRFGNPVEIIGNNAIKIAANDNIWLDFHQDGIDLDKYYLSILNIEDLPEWNPISRIESPSELSVVRNIQIIGSYVNIYGRNGIWKVDISNPESPRDLGFHEFDEFRLREVEFEGNLACAFETSARHSEFRLFDIGGHNHPNRLWTSDYHFGMIGKIQTLGNFLYLDKSPSGLKILHIEDPDTLVEVADVDNHIRNHIEFDVSGDWLRALRNDYNFSYLDFYNIANLDSTYSAYSYRLGGAGMQDFEVQDDLMYIIGLIKTVIYDVSMQEEPELIATYNGIEGTTIAINGEFAYVGGSQYENENYRGIIILDISDPEHVSVLDSIEFDVVTQIEVDGEFGYASTNSGQLWTLDLYFPFLPFPIGFWQSESNIESFYLSGNHLIVATGAGGIRIVDVSDPDSPVESGHFQSSELYMDAVVLDDYVYATSPRTVTIFDISEALNIVSPKISIPTSLNLQAYPNPFNSQLQIQYSMPKSGYVHLSVYNTTGQLVGQLVNEYQNAGHYQTTWHVESTSTGIYFLRLEAGANTSYKKIVHLK